MIGERQSNSVDEVPEGQTVSFTTEYELNTVAQVPAAPKTGNILLHYQHVNIHMRRPDMLC